MSGHLRIGTPVHDDCVSRAEAARGVVLDDASAAAVRHEPWGPRSRDYRPLLCSLGACPARR
jgi:hypothetical protein